MIVFALLVLLVQSVACQDDNSTLFILNLNNFTKTDNNTETENQKCSVGSRNNLPCLCGDSLIMAHELYRKRLLDTCTNYSVTEDMSPFSFCSEALLSLGYNIEKSYVTDDLISNSSFENGTFSNITLAEMISSLKSSMLVFQEVLKRTIVGVLVETEGQRCSCLVSFRLFFPPFIFVITLLSNLFFSLGQLQEVAVYHWSSIFYQQLEQSSAN